MSTVTAEQAGRRGAELKPRSVFAHGMQGPAASVGRLADQPGESLRFRPSQGSSGGFPSFLQRLWDRRQAFIAAVALAGIASHLALHFARPSAIAWSRVPLLAVLTLGGVPLVVELLAKLWRREFGSDLLAGISIVTSALLGEYLAGSVVVLMLSGGQTLEAFAVGRASSVLRRWPGECLPSPTANRVPV